MGKRVMLGGLALWIVLAARPGQCQGVPDSIVAEGVPPIPRDLARNLKRYQNTRAATFAGWTFYGGMLILTRFADTPQVHMVASHRGARTQVTFLDERVLAALPRPRSDRNQFVYTTDEGGAENFQITFVNGPTGASRRLTDGKSRNVLGAWSHSGRLLAFSGNARNGKDMDLYVADPDGPNPPRLLKEVSGSWTVTDWAPDGRRLVALEYVSINESYVHLIDVRTGRSELVTPRPAKGKPTVAYADARWSKDGESLYWISDEDSEFRRLARYDLATKKVTPFWDVKSRRPVSELPAPPQANAPPPPLGSEWNFPAIPWDVEQFDISDNGSTIVFSTNEDGVSRLNCHDIESGNIFPTPELASGQVVGLKFRPGGSKEFAYSLTSAHAPADVYSYTPGENQFQRWTFSETGGLDTGHFATPELIHYPSFDQREIPAFVYYPDPEKFPGPRPVLITIHGGPESQVRPVFLGWLNYWLEEKGVALVFPNVRGSAGYGKSYLLLDNGLKREDSVKDIGALLHWIAKDPGLDAKRVAVSGGSYGGYMSLATMTHYSDRLKAGIDIVGISSFLTFLKNTKGYRLDLRRAEYGDERDPKMSAHLEAISPLSNADKIKVPLLIVQGKNDPRVPLSESEQMLAAARKNGGPVWYVLGKNEGHGFAKKPNQDYLQYVEVMFLQKYLLGEGD